MQKFAVLFSAVLTLFPIWGFAAAPTMVVFPETVIQGESVMIVIENVSGAAAIRQITFDGKAVGVFLYQEKPTALLGIDLKKRAGDYKVVVTIADGTKLEKTISVGERPKISAPLGIPEKLGGNTPQAATKLVSSLAQENYILNSLWSQLKALWTEKFIFPIEKPIVTDSYGYTRETIGYLIAHKGVDFKALEGTPVFAMNRGVVRLVRNFRNYGKTVVVDHGLGLFSFYMHLSKIKVNKGELVMPRQLVGFSGSSGYALEPHLHLSVRVQNTSIDPMKFMNFFQ